ncbi:hypothetical protein KBB96_17545 [Luteolibacter ambystomatis]|uniref:Endonuclease/exonuclease/phosphatase domain-containing protein n=1 Tax=Luteolibacter ambystomatis TaxID=2824561 RepID=A0A975G986_9BACT|nr:endonuclease/exonuclease/phosphatase family protein [Luteolibacter ambystomatis]QUE50650.1 hypothetical protein KBB96_17545 [Luteolibacter ambystomatis]
MKRTRKAREKSGPPVAGWRRITGIAALVLAVVSVLVSSTVRDQWVPTALVMFATPWLVRLGLVAFVLSTRPGKVMVWIAMAVALLSGLEGWRSFRWRDEKSVATKDGFDVTLWNCGHRLSRMPEQWSELAGPDTRVVVLIEAGVFSAEEWAAFTTAAPELDWHQLEGGIVVGVRGRFIGSELFEGLPKLRCHRIQVSISGVIHTVLACDVPSQPWLLREPYLDRIRTVAKERRCLIAGDFNTPPAAVGYDDWRRDFTFANAAQTRGFVETWPFGVPLLQLDQLWLSHDLKCTSVIRQPSLHSDHARMTFHVAPAIR